MIAVITLHRADLEGDGGRCIFQVKAPVDQAEGPQCVSINTDS